LPAADGGQHVAQPVVVADLRVLVVRRRIARLGRKLARMVDQPLVGRDQHAAARGGDDLVAVEREGAHQAEGARRPPFVRGAQRLGCILDHRHVVARTGRQDRVQVRALAVEVHGDDGLGQLAGPRPRGQRLLQQARIHVPRRPFAVNEGRPAAQIDDRVDAGREGEGRDQYLVARADAGQDQRQVQRGRAGGERQCIRRADGRSELGLERVHLRPEGRNPVGREDLLDELLLQAGHVGWRKVDAGHGSSDLHPITIAT